MKTYLIICDNQAVADKVNDYITVNSLFTEGETITEPAVKKSIRLHVQVAQNVRGNLRRASPCLLYPERLLAPFRPA